MENGLLKRLMSSIKCSSCGQHYQEQNVEVLGNSGGMWHLQAICSACHTQSLVVAIIQRSDERKGRKDGRVAKPARVSSARVVNADDLLNMHEFLKGFDGNFRCLFGRERL